METAFQRWYAKHKTEFNAQRKARYHSDPEYRQKIVEGIREKRTKQRSQTPQKPRHGFTIGEAASMIERTPQTIRAWEEANYIPKTVDSKGYRVYSPEQVSLMRKLAVVLDDYRYHKASQDQLDEVLAHVQGSW